MQYFEHRCPNPDCRAILSIPETMRGRNARCAKCNHSFFVPYILRPAEKKTRPLRKAG